MKGTLLSLLSIALVVYISMGVLLAVFQRSFIYYPTPDIETDYETIMLNNEGESINVFVLNGLKEDAILYFGGNAESMATTAAYISEQFPEHTVYLMDYRGYGSSSGKPTQDGIYSDAIKLYDEIKGKHQRIHVGGRSLGSSVAVYVASKREVAKLALITPFDSIVAVGKEMYPIYPVSWILSDAYDSKSRAEKVAAKTFVVMAEHDKIISKERTESLIEAFEPSQLVVKVIKERGHNDISLDPVYYVSLQAFILNP